MTTPTLEGRTPESLLDDHIEPFLKHLRAAGYAERTLRKKRTVARAFARWAKRKQIPGNDLNDAHIAAFVARSPRRRKAHVKFELAAIRLFFEYLRGYVGLQRPPLQNGVSAADALLQNYQDYLRKDRGLTENSVHVYVPFIRDFLAAQTTQTGGVSPKSFDTLVIRNFILEHTVDRSSEYTRLLCTALRSFFRFLVLCGQTPRDLSNAVPMVRQYRQAVVPAFLSPDEVDRLLKTTEGSTLSGRRDHAILLLLARLGLRAGEIVSLELDDIRWRAGEIVVRGKGRIVDHLPLLSDVGEALALYLREDRGISASRRVFLRIWAPRSGLMGPAAVGHIVRRALAQSGVHRSGRGAAHLFRHGLATKMIRHGASMSEIAEVLRHRSQTTTAIYAQVSFGALRAVALPWPATGGAR
ncbi:MAG: tyrosine-type recombinase/integrase [Bryobacteraceae bacterium]|jgi:site-specific recombinase XerD